MKSTFLAGLAVLATLFTQDPEPKGPTPPSVGKAAPSLRLNDHTGNAVSLGGESRTWTVLAFFPKAATPG